MNKDNKELIKQYQLIKEAFEPVDYDSGINDNVRKLLGHIMKQIDDSFTRTRRYSYRHVDISNEEIMRHDEYLSELREHIYEELITLLKKMDNNFEKDLEKNKVFWEKPEDYTDFLKKRRYQINYPIERGIGYLKDIADPIFHYRLSHIQKYIDANMKTAISPDDIENAFAK